MGYGGMPRKKKDEFDWDNADSLADLEKEPEGTGTISGTAPDKKGKDKKGKKKGGKGDDSDEEAPPPQPKRFDSVEDLEDKDADKKGKTTPAKPVVPAPTEQVNGESTNSKGAKGKAAKGKKGKGKDSDSEEEDAAAPAAPAGKPAASKGKKNKKGKKGQDSSDEEESSNAAAADETAQPAKTAAASKSKKGKKGKKGQESSEDEDDESPKKGAAGKGNVSFAALQGDEDEDEDEDEEADVPKKGSKTAAKGKAAASFAALAGDDDDEEDEEEEAEEEETSAKSKPSKAKKGKGKKGHDDDDDDDDDGFSKASKASKPTKPKAPVKAPAASFAALMGDGSDNDAQDDDEAEPAAEVKPAAPVKVEKSGKDKKDKEKGDKGDKSKKPEPVVEEKLPALTVEEGKVLKEILKKCVFQGVVVGLIKTLEKHPKADNLYMITVTDGGFTEAQVVTNSKTVEVGMKVAFAPVGSEVFDEELGTGTTTVKPVKIKNVNSAGMLCSGKLLGLNEDGDNVLLFPPKCPLGIDAGEAYIRLVKPEMLEEAKAKAHESRRLAEEALAAKKAAKDAKDAKKAAEVVKPEGDGAEAGDGDASKKKKGGKEVKVNSKVAALQEMQRRLKEEQDRLAKIAEDQRKAEEEAERQWKEEEERRAKEKERKKELKKLRDEELRKQGLLLSKKQKEQKAKDEAYRKQLEAQGVVPPRPKDAKEGESSSSDEEGGEKSDKSGAGVQRLSKNDIKKQEAERKARLRAMQEERARRKEEEEKAKEEAERIERELASLADNWEDDAKDDGTGGAEQAAEEEESSDSGSEYDSDDQKLSKTQRRSRKLKRAAEARRMRRMEQNLGAKSKDNLRCPVICVLGHVDTGKTKILDKLRRTNVQDGEAGGITQQIGASYFPIENIIEKTIPVMKLHNVKYNVPGLLTIDTPGHESFTNLRTRGSSLCDLAVLVVDIMHGLEPQTIESIGLLKKRKAPFIIALNKIDRLFGWVSSPEQPVQQTLEEQAQNVKDEFENRYNFVVTQLAEQGLNACTFYTNKDVRTYINMVPTSAISGDGMMDLLFLLATLPSKMLVEQIMYHENLESTVLEVKAIEGLGTTMDVILVNGRLKEKDTIVVCGLDGPIVTQIRSLLTPQPMKEMRVKTPYLHHKEVKGAQGVKICANGIERALAGSNLLVLGEDDDLEELKDDVMKDIGGILKKVRKNEDGVYVQSSTLGSLEALLEFLEHPGEDRDGVKNKAVPVSGIGIGPVSKFDVMRCGVMLEREREWVKMCEKEYAATGEWMSGNPMNSIKEAYACILAFNVPVLPDAERLAKEIGIPIYTAEIIYHLFDAFTKRVNDIKARKKEEARKKAVYPVVFKIVDERCVFNKKDPYILGVDVLEGELKLGTPVLIPDVKWTGNATTQEPAKELLEFGQVMSIEKDKKPIDSANRLTGSVAIRIEQRRNMREYTFGRHWTHESMFVSRLNRESIDLLKEHFREDVPKDDWKLVVKIKKLLNIP